jgi:hypothetical protein
MPSIKDSIPQCYDTEGKFNDSCGNILTVFSSNGLINYMIENEINQKIEMLINNSLNNTIDMNQTMNQTRQEIMALNNSLASRIFAQGTFDTGNVTNTINNTIINNTTGQGGNLTVVIEGNSQGNATNDVSNVVVEGEGSGNATNDVSNVVVEESEENSNNDESNWVVD